jgi:DNA-binding transcriptional ArsR family regulator
MRPLNPRSVTAILMGDPSARLVRAPTEEEAAFAARAPRAPTTPPEPKRRNSPAPAPRAAQSPIERKMSQTFKLMKSNATVLRLLYEGRSFTTQELSQLAGIERPTVNAAIFYIRRCGLSVTRKEGRYGLSAAVKQQITERLGAFAEDDQDGRALPCAY